MADRRPFPNIACIWKVLHSDKACAFQTNICFDYMKTRSEGQQWLHQLTKEKAMNAKEFDELAGRIEALARVMLHLVGRLEDGEVIDGPAMAEGLRRSIVINDQSNLLMKVAKRTLDNAADIMDESRDYRKFRALAMTPPKRGGRQSKCAVNGTFDKGTGQSKATPKRRAA